MLVEEAGAGTRRSRVRWGFFAFCGRAGVGGFEFAGGQEGV